MTYAHQFALPFAYEHRYVPEDFLVGACNEDALAWIETPGDWPTKRLAIYGDEGTGKTHLLHVFAARHHAALLPAEAVRRLVPPPDAAALAIDDADSVVDEVALLHLLNAAAERFIPVLLTARVPPARWGFRLPDLVSRLRAMPTVALLAPDDGLLRALLARLLADHQLRVPERLQEFLLARLPRTGGALREAAARLDRLSLAEGGTITRRIAQCVVDELGAAAETDPNEENPEDEPPGLL
jgi:chromosomal replication initiation ATPase DnaA